MPSNPPARESLSLVHWLILILASIGFAFDIYELLMAPYVMPYAIKDLVGAEPGTPEFVTWFSRLFYIPAFAGGLFGLLGGYLTDRLGRRRVLTWSILIYAFSAFAAGFSTSIEMLLVLRCTTFVGVCVEFVAAIAWLAELFPEPTQRERVLGYTQAFSSVGGLLVSGVNWLIVLKAAALPAIVIPAWMSFLGGIDQAHAPWRYTLMSGLIPAIPLILIRPFLPESPAWAAKKAAGTLRRPSLAELFSPELRRTTIVTTLMFACSYGAAFGAIQQQTQIVPGLPEVKKAAEGKPNPRLIGQAKAAKVGMAQETGGLVGRFLLAVLALRIVSRRKLLRLFQVPGLILMPVVFAYAGVQSLSLFSVGMFLVGLFTVAQFSFWGNYLPRVYPLHLRGTGESFAANIGGRMLGTSFAAATQYLAISSIIPGTPGPAKVAYAAAAIGTLVYAAGLLLSFWLPEPSEHELAD